MDKEPEAVLTLQYRSALRKARRAPLNWFQMFGIVVGVIAGFIFFLGFGWTSFVAGGVAFFLADRYNRRKIREQIMEVRVRFGQLEG